MVRGHPYPVAGRSRRPSGPPFSRRRLRSAIHGSAEHRSAAGGWSAYAGSRGTGSPSRSPCSPRRTTPHAWFPANPYRVGLAIFIAREGTSTNLRNGRRMSGCRQRQRGAEVRLGADPRPERVGGRGIEVELERVAGPLCTARPARLRLAVFRTVATWGRRLRRSFDASCLFFPLPPPLLELLP